MIFLYLFLVIAGVLNTIQTGSNSTMHKHLQHPIVPGLVTLSGGLLVLFVALLVYSLATGTPLPTKAQWLSAPWWAWIGGCMGAVYVLAMVNASQKVGAGVFIGITVTAAIITSLAMDHWAFVGFKQHTATPLRLLGGALMIGGLMLVAKF